MSDSIKKIALYYLQKHYKQGDRKRFKVKWMSREHRASENEKQAPR